MEDRIYKVTVSLNGEHLEAESFIEVNTRYTEMLSPKVLGSIILEKIKTMDEDSNTARTRDSMDATRRSADTSTK